MRTLIYILALFSMHLVISQSSVLSSGTWYKVGITRSGIFKLDQSALSGLGINTGSLDPQKISIYGNGVEGVLPQPNSEARPIDLLENAIFVQSGSDGTFDNTDFILFYAQGPDKTIWTTEGLSYEKNSYSDTSYYFIRIDDNEGKRISSKPNLTVPATAITHFNDAIIFEEDLNNILSSGRGWYGELYSSGETHTFPHSIPGVTSGISLVVDAISQSSAPNFFSISNNGTPLGDLNLGVTPTGPGTTYSIKARQAVDTFQIGQTNELNIQFTYEGNTASGRGFLDYYVLLFERALQLYDNQTTFRNTTQTGVPLSYQITGVNTATIWDITDPVNISSQQFDQVGGTATFVSQSPEIEEFVIFSGSDFPTPTLFGAVKNQNIRAATDLDGIIVTHPRFLAEANRLAQFHQTNDGLSIKVVTIYEVYNEFSSGRQDITAIRDYARHVYQGGNLKYLLLFGDCSFDYKYRKSENTNFVPTYESLDSFHPIFSHSSDDYFGFFEFNEGEWGETVAGDHTMEIGIGRLPVRTEEEATAIVDKIIYYATNPATLGKWKNQIAYLADDGDGNIHAKHVEQLSKLIDTTYSQYIVDKLLLDAFEQEAGAAKEASPETTDALKTRIKDGAFFVNFIGHGNERLWTDEEVLTRSLISEFTNKSKMPVFVTATCEFGKYDDPDQVSGAEELLLNTNGGAIALLTTTRPVFASTNFELNKAFHEHIFRKINGVYPRLGDIIRETKNGGLAGPVNRNFSLLGDPMLMPAYPQLDIVIHELENESDTLSALEKVTFTGEIQSGGTPDPDFNGTLLASVFDIEQTFTTKGQQSDPFVYELRNNAVFRGEVTVTDGTFSFSFIVPKNISYQFRKGKMSLYAWDETNVIDASGSSTDFVLGGTDASAPQDDQPPAIDMYLNDESSRNGATVGRSSLLFARLEDENGITTTNSGFIQGITLQLDGKTIDLGGFYQADPDSYTSGMVTYPIQNLEPGDYTATLKVYDTHNNAAETTIQFQVADEALISVFNRATYPNPVTSSATFYFEHDREEEDLEVSLIVYNAHGGVVSQTDYLVENSERSIQLPWEPRTNSGQLLIRGVYFYRLTIKSNLDGAIKEISDKLVIIN